MIKCLLINPAVAYWCDQFTIIFWDATLQVSFSQVGLPGSYSTSLEKKSVSSLLVIFLNDPRRIDVSVPDSCIVDEATGRGCWTMNHYRLTLWLFTPFFILTRGGYRSTSSINLFLVFYFCTWSCASIFLCFCPLNIQPLKTEGCSKLDWFYSVVLICRACSKQRNESKFIW